MRTAFKNPVTKSPWKSNMPNNYRGSQTAASSASRLDKLADLNVKSNRQHPRRPRKPTAKMQLTQIYFEQLVPLYPFLSKTQVRAAITLANNNLHQSRVFLDLADKFMKVPPLNLVLNFQFKGLSHSPEGNGTNDSFTTALQSKSSVSCVQSNRQILSGTSLSASDNSNSSTYDFSDSEYSLEHIRSLSNHKMQIAKKKVGVSIIRCNKGYKAFLL